MGFYLYTGNKLEALAEQKLCRLLQEKSLQDSFKKEKIIVQSQGMSSWLKLQIAKFTPICANIDFLFLNSFINEVFHKTLPEELKPNTELFTPDILTWKIYSILPSIAEEHPEIASYLHGRNKILKQYQLAEKLAYSFDQYEIFRPDIILNWENNVIEDSTNKWQAKIWQKITASNSSRSKGFLNFFTSADLSVLNYERIFVFGITTMPAVYIDFFQKLGMSDKLDVHFFYLNPCRKNWSYILSDKEEKQIRKKLSLNNIMAEENYIEKGNTLLSSFGQTGREFFSAILDSTEYNNEELFIDPGKSSILKHVQNEILNNTPTPKRPETNNLPNDRSIQIHNCHNKTREIEVLFDNILDIIENDSSIQPGDIIVTTPDISSYEPFIKSVFNRRNAEISEIPILPYTFSDIRHSKNSRVLNTFIKILELVNSKYKMSDVLDILETSAVRESFEIEDESLDLIRKWTDQTEMKWGIDSKHRANMGLPSFDNNSIQSGINRMLLGFALEDCDHIYDNKIIPFDEIEISESILLGKFSSYLTALFKLQELFNAEYTITHWHHLLIKLIDDFFINNNDSFRDISLLITVINSLNESAELAKFESKVPLEIIKAYIEEHIDSETINEGFLRGRVTFCTMLPMRGIPAKVICMLGMNDSDFPRQETKLGFNIINKEVRLCDRSKRFEDRYIFLESILAAREILYISYTGQNDKSYEISPPATPVCELVDYLKHLFGNNIEKAIIINHKLQAFNSSYFNNSEKSLFSYSVLDCNAAETLTFERGSTANSISAKFNVKANKIKAINIEELISFFKNPCKEFLNQTLNAGFTSIDKIMSEDTEHFEIDSLDKYNLTQDILAEVIQEKDKDTVFQRLNLSGKLQVGIRGEFYFNKLLSQIEEIISSESDKIPAPKILLKETDNTPFEINLKDNITLTGLLENVSIENRYQVYLKLAKESGKRIIESWIRHLCLVASGIGEKTFYFICKPGETNPCVGTFANISIDEACKHLTTLSELYLEGLQRPLPFFAETSYVFAKGKKKKTQRARKSFIGNSFASLNTESNDPYIRRCFNENIIETDEFCKISHTVFRHFWVEEEVDS